MRIKVNDRVILNAVRKNMGAPYTYNDNYSEIHGEYPDHNKITATVIDVFKSSVLLRIEGYPDKRYINNPLYIPNTLILWYNKASISKVLTNKVTYEESL